jgi:repressor LexA
MHPIKQLRQSRRVGQKELAAVMEVSQATVSEWENGRKSPSTENIRKLAAYFGVSADFLLRAEGSAPAVPVMGRVAAGIPISAAEDILDYEELHDRTVKKYRSWKSIGLHLDLDD